MSEIQPQSLGAAAVRPLHRPVELNWKRLNLIGGVLAAIGIVGFVIALLLGRDDRVWHIYLVNFLFFIGIAQGGVVLSCGYYLTQGRWTRHAVHIRVAEAGWPFLIVGAVLFWGIFAGREHIFPWIMHPVVKKAAWLNAPFMFTRDGIALILLAIVSAWFVSHSRGRAAMLWASEPLTIEMPPTAIRRLAPLVGVLYIFLYTMLAIDLIMSLAPLWHSTLFGWWWFEMCFWSAICGSAFVATYFRRRLGPETAFSDQSILHDYGKLVFAFSIFWMYLSFAQYLVIWYGDLPTETFFLILRFWHRPWEPFAWLCPMLNWVVPFFVLMGVKPKKNPVILRTVALLGMVGVWLTDFVMVVPSLSPNHVPLGWVELSITAGFLGIFLLCLNPGLQLAARMATSGAGGMER
ncbi:MAG TPA: hypothetical protein VKS22_10970 [Candidatus Binataceae bacterium]|nr:hypothetical protein [Candidatus Binataceae bacterium]